MSSYSFYCGLQKALKKNDKKDVRKELQLFAKTNSCVSYICYMFSYLTCCCFCKCGDVCLKSMEVSNNWKKSLFLYESLTKEQANTLFHQGIEVLCTIEWNIIKKMHKLNTEIIQKERAGDITGYTISKTSKEMIECDLKTESWIQKLTCKLRSEIIVYNRYNSSILFDYGVHVSHNDVRTLIASLGMFYPCTQDYSKRVFDNTTQEIIQKAIRDFIHPPQELTYYNLEKSKALAS